jgi:hypothetical protein
MKSRALARMYSGRDLLNLQLSGQHVAHGDIFNEKIFFNPFPGETMTPKIFWKVIIGFIYMHYLTNLI